MHRKARKNPLVDRHVPQFRPQESRVGHDMPIKKTGLLKKYPRYKGKISEIKNTDQDRKIRYFDR